MPDLVLDHQLGSHLALSHNPVLNISLEGTANEIATYNLLKADHSKVSILPKNEKQRKSTSSSSLENSRLRQGSSSSDHWYSTSEGCDSSVIDLILSMTGGRRSVSASDVSSNDRKVLTGANVRQEQKNGVDEPNTLIIMSEEDLVACAAERREHGFRVTFTDNRKVYVAPKPNSNYDILLGTENMYRSYLSLMPEGDEEEAKNQLREERRPIL